MTLAEKRTRAEIRQKWQPAQEPAGSAPQHKSFEREEDGADRAAHQRADHWCRVFDIAVEPANQAAGDDDPDETAEWGRMQHRRRQ